MSRFYLVVKDGDFEWRRSVLGTMEQRVYGFDTLQELQKLQVEAMQKSPRLIYMYVEAPDGDAVDQVLKSLPEPKEKQIHFVLDDGCFGFSARVIAINRAAYYAKNYIEEGITGNEGVPLSFEEVFLDEFNISMADEEELIDWLRNNMDWKDVADYVRSIEPKVARSMEDQFRDVQEFIIK